MIKLLGLALLVMAFSVSATNLPRQSAVPGGVVIVPLAVITDEKPVVTYNKQHVMVLKQNEQWLAVVGVPLNVKIGTQRVTVTSAGKTSKTLFEIEDKAYPTQHITITDKRKVNPTKYDMTRINAEKAKTGAALKHWTEGDVAMNFIWPIEGRVSGLFGRRRVFNGQPKRPHSGMDIAAPTGTEIHAPADGVVRDTGDYFFNGNTVFIDHGQGLMTLFLHLDKIGVETGQTVKQGEIIGSIHVSGRYTQLERNGEIYPFDTKSKLYRFSPLAKNKEVKNTHFLFSDLNKYFLLPDGQLIRGIYPDEKTIMRRYKQIEDLKSISKRKVACLMCQKIDCAGNQNKNCMGRKQYFKNLGLSSTGGFSKTYLLYKSSI